MEARNVVFNIGSISIAVDGFDKVLTELDKATNQYVITDLLWLLSKFLSEKKIRQRFMKVCSVSDIVRQLLKHIMYFIILK